MRADDGPADDRHVLRVALPLPLPRLFDYRPPRGIDAHPRLVGCRLRVPFGPRELVGIVSAVGVAEAEVAELKTATALLDPEPLLAGELLDTLRWCARYYHEPLGEVLATALPAPLRIGEPLPETAIFVWRLTEAGQTARMRLRAHSRPRRLADRLARSGADEDRLDDEITGWRAAARTLARRGLIERIALTRAQDRGLRAARQEQNAGDPAYSVLSPQPSALVLNAAQQAAIAAIRASQGFAPILLEGVTGSGKTEVYLHAIADCLARGQQALVLVPEIGLTPQTLARFRTRLGLPVHSLHSALTDGERARTWTMFAKGEARVLVGTRSAIFAPLPEPGLIVVDEEHDSSYKQRDGLRYCARDLALVRGRALGVPVLLGSATPSLESLHNALAGRYAYLRLPQRAGEARAPAVRVLDVRKRPLEAGLSAQMFEAIARCLARGEQVLVFRNRRGYAPVLLCHDCGWSAKCRRCSTPTNSVAMTVHARGGRLICHHCDARAAAPKACPDCASLALQPQGAGTERIEDALAARFPDARVLRVDRETTRRRDAMQQHLAALGDGPGILVGTQMLAKGHDLPNLTLVCVVGVDEGLYSADFRAPERLAQLLIQVAGRAGRAQRPGEVLLQTHHPEHPLLTTLLAGGYPAFAGLELAQREAAGFPPYAYLALLRAEATREGAMQAFLHEARDALAASDAVIAHGPLPAPMPRRAGRARGQLLLSATQRPALQTVLDAWTPRLYDLPGARKVRWSLDVDPLDLY